MEENKRHVCKFCCKAFPCGRSLGGHMRSHLINTSSSSDHHKNDQNLPKKKLPPLTNTKHNPRTDVSIKRDCQLSYVLMENPKKMKKFANKNEVDTLLDQEKLCKECGKTFHSWKALFGHMKSHSVTGKATISFEEDSWENSSDHQKLNFDNQSDNEAAIPLRRRKRSERTKRYTNSNVAAHFSPSDSEIDQQEQEEVALSLILLSSMDKGSLVNSVCMNSVVESSGTGFESLEAKESFRTQRKRVKSSYADEFCEGFECNESEVTSPKSLITKNGLDHFRPDFAKKSKFKCIICKKEFPSYQALGGHRASHKKFKGCCAPTSDQNSLETQFSPDQNENVVGSKKDKEHECAICFKVFGSGQALGGHKRSHLINDRPKSIDPSVCSKKSIQEGGGFLDLNLPAPVEEECDEFKAWWVRTSHKHQLEPLLGLLSS